jgi:hypothetical protein
MAGAPLPDVAASPRLIANNRLPVLLDIGLAAQVGPMFVYPRFDVFDPPHRAHAEHVIRLWKIRTIDYLPGTLPAHAEATGDLSASVQVPRHGRRVATPELAKPQAVKPHLAA